MGKAIDLPAILSERAKKEGRASGVLEVHCVNEKRYASRTPPPKDMDFGGKDKALASFF